MVITQNVKAGRLEGPADHQVRLAAVVHQRTLDRRYRMGRHHPPQFQIELLRIQLAQLDAPWIGKVDDDDVEHVVDVGEEPVRIDVDDIHFRHAERARCEASRMQVRLVHLDNLPLARFDGA